MHNIIFDWDANKNRINIRRHGISFYEAVSAFSDENAVLIADEEHSEEEDRFVLLGLSEKARLLVVCHCYRESDLVIRIISARKATKPEWIQYGGELYEG